MMKNNKIFNTICVLSLIITAGVFIQSCSKNEFSEIEEPLYEKYLWIDNFSSKTDFSEDENGIFMDALERIQKALEIKDHLCVINRTAQQLNIAEDMYIVFQNIVTSANLLALDKKTIRLKSGSEGGSEGEGLFDEIKCQAMYVACIAVLLTKSGSDFSIECFNKYWSGDNSQMDLSHEKFNDIKNWTPPFEKIPESNKRKIMIDGKDYYQADISFYGTPYGYSLGTATITFNSQGTPVGLSDTYDFNPGAEGRDKQAEFATKEAGKAGATCGAKAYKISYGVIIY
ncbi:MAG: hypothetical protein LBG92_06840 [Prevotellaceae bacterium]|jgi:hypothetical protein|nr:hypothetical protein [Prevotellaceae bacterium]